jgi:glycosyltransferase involved in cell wall biosynthesis
MQLPESETISIIVPLLLGKEFINPLLESIEVQTLQPQDVIFIISESDEASDSIQLIYERDSLNTIYKLVKPSNPGKARNIGAELSNSNLLAFLDIRTIPDRNWLKNSYKQLIDADLSFIGGMRNCAADTPYKNLLKTTTHGNIPSQSLAGSLVRAKDFNSEAKFKPNMRAGEDWEWINRFTQNYSSKWSESVDLTYHGLPSNIFVTLSKWYTYSIENSKANVFVVQKFLYFLLFIASLISLYSWNYLSTGGEWSSSPYFVPHLNKVVWFFLFLFYFIYRAIVRPIRLEVSKHYLFPFNWFAVGWIGVLIDLVKAPGRVVGFIRYARQVNGFKK